MNEIDGKIQQGRNGGRQAERTPGDCGQYLGGLGLNRVCGLEIDRLLHGITENRVIIINVNVNLTSKTGGS